MPLFKRPGERIRCVSPGRKREGRFTASRIQGFDQTFGSYASRLTYFLEALKKDFATLKKYRLMG